MINLPIKLVDGGLSWYVFYIMTDLDRIMARWGAQWGNALAELVSDALQTLLQEKHLYQTVAVDEACCSKLIEEDLAKERNKDKLEAASKHVWEITSRRIWIPDCQKPSGGATEGISCDLPFKIPGIKNFCPVCSRREAFNPYAHENFPPAHVLTVERISSESEPFVRQVFSFIYECQSCKQHLVSFLVEREQWAIKLSGRNPIETIEVPKYIPKNVRRFYRATILAYNCDQILPAIFMLRTTIEQFMRSVVDVEGKMSGEDLADKYAETLPDDFKQRYPSLKPIYEKLSDAIHKAKDDAELFESEEEKVMAHFDAKETMERLSLS